MLAAAAAAAAGTGCPHEWQRGAREGNVCLWGDLCLLPLPSSGLWVVFYCLFHRLPSPLAGRWAGCSPRAGMPPGRRVFGGAAASLRSTAPCCARSGRRQREAGRKEGEFPRAPARDRRCCQPSRGWKWCVVFWNAEQGEGTWGRIFCSGKLTKGCYSRNINNPVAATQSTI